MFTSALTSSDEAEFSSAMAANDSIFSKTCENDSTSSVSFSDVFIMFLVTTLILSLDVLLSFTAEFNLLFSSFKVSNWSETPSMSFSISLINSVKLTFMLSTASLVCSDSFLTSSATTEKPLPASPALWASIAAFKASKLVWDDIEETKDTISDIPSTFCCISAPVFFTSSNLFRIRLSLSAVSFTFPKVFSMLKTAFSSWSLLSFSLFTTFFIDSTLSFNISTVCSVSSAWVVAADATCSTTPDIPSEVPLIFSEIAVRLSLKVFISSVKPLKPTKSPFTLSL